MDSEPSSQHCQDDRNRVSHIGDISNVQTATKYSKIAQKLGIAPQIEYAAPCVMKASSIIRSKDDGRNKIVAVT